MRFVHKWSFICASHVASVMKENHQKRAVYYYGFFIIIGTFIKAAIFTSVALLLGILTPIFIIVFTFGSLRMLAGGFHMNTYGKCLFVSMGIFILAALIAQYTCQYWNFLSMIIFISFTLLIGIYVLIKYAPKDTPNKPITDPLEIKKYKSLSIIYLIAWLIICIIGIAFKFKLIIVSMSFGILLELFTITPAGHNFFLMIMNRIDQIVQKSVKKVS